MQILYYLNGDLLKEQPYSIINIYLAQWYFIISVIFQIILNKGTRDEDEMKMCPQIQLNQMLILKESLQCSVFAALSLVRIEIVVSAMLD